MSYLVLARKWRPKQFTELAGQEHVVRALVNALESGRVHHAFLFTGTRGVGKTTIARIFAKSLNCQTGVTAHPCGTCSTCREIDEGRFVDLLEVDAASRTKVDDTRELLDNVQYAPARGRYKVYLIDEVHMLSTHSFNALLKTLEEPPPHVKFLLATTDPQKLPVTVLSRCLQFNLKRMPQSVISSRLSEILAAEQIPYEAEAVRLIARSAQGSMRDALSLLDQAIAFSGNSVNATETRAMLGTVDRRHIVLLAQALANRNPREILKVISELDELAPDYRDVLGELALLLQKMALAKAVPDLLTDDEFDDASTINPIIQLLTAEEIQLFYQIAVIGRRDLDLAPEPRAGFEMVLLRMHAFRLLEDSNLHTPQTGQAVSRETAAVKNATNSSVISRPNNETHQDWSSLIRAANLSGLPSQLAAHCSLVAKLPDKLQLSLDHDGEHLRRPAVEEKLRQALSTVLSKEIKLEFVTQVGQSVADTPAKLEQAALADRYQAATRAIYDDHNIKTMMDVFGAAVQPESIKPIDKNS